MAVPFIPGAMTDATRNRYPLALDDYENETRDYNATPSTLPLRGCSFQPREGSEFLTETDRFTERADFYAPPADILGFDTVTIPGRGEYKIDGPVKVWPNVGGLGHVHMVLVRYREGA